MEDVKSRCLYTKNYPFRQSCKRRSAVLIFSLDKETNRMGGKEKMKTADTKNQVEFDNRQLNWSGNPTDRVSLTDQTKGYLIIPEGVGDDLGDKRCAQEHHNSGHALWYLSMAVHALIHENPSQISSEKTERIIGHLTCLREFLPDDNPYLRVLVTGLLRATETEKPGTYSEWLRFVYTHWQAIRTLAERYGNHDKCFPMTAYLKISDLVNNRQWRKLWWWKLEMHKLNLVLKQVMKGGQKREEQEKRNRKKN